MCSVFEGLQIIYSPFRRRELFSFDRFIWRRSAPCAIASRNIDDAYIHGPSRLFLSPSLSVLFLSLERQTSTRSQPCLSLSLYLSICDWGFLKNEPGHYFYAALHVLLLLLLLLPSGPAVIRVTGVQSSSSSSSSSFPPA